MTGQYGELAQQVLGYAQSGDNSQLLQIARRAGPMVARMLGVPEWIVQCAEVGVDYLGVVPDTGLQPNGDGSYDSPGAEGVYRWLRRLDYGLILIVGAPRQGKTAFGCRCGEVWLDGGVARRVFFVTPNPQALEGTPLLPFLWDEHVLKRLAALGQGDALIVPDAGLYLDALNFGSSVDRLIRELTVLLGQRGVKVVLDVQTSALLSKSAMLARAVFYKPLGPMFAATERDSLVTISRRAERAFAEMPPSAYKRHMYAIVSDLRFEGFVSYNLPTFYTDAISKPHSIGYGRVIDMETGDDVTDAVEIERAHREAIEQLMAKHGYTEIQAEALLYMREHQQGKGNR